MPDTTTEATGATSQEEVKNSTPAATDTGTQTAKPESAPSEKTFTQAEVGRIVKKELADAKAKAEREAAEIEARAKGEHEKLATQYKTERDTFEQKFNSLSEQHEALKAAVSVLTKAELKALPEPVRELVATDDPLLLLERLPKAKKAAEAMERPEMSANQRGPQPVGRGADAAVEAAKKQLRAKGNYNGL